MIINGREILTAGHFVTSCPSPFYAVETADGELRAAYITGLSLERDLARLRIYGDDRRFTVREPKLARAHGAVCFEPGTRKRSCGTVSSVKPKNIDHTAQTVKGNSGSGMYDRLGRLVGIVVTCHTATEGVCATTGGGATPLK